MRREQILDALSFISLLTWIAMSIQILVHVSCNKRPFLIFLIS